MLIDMIPDRLRPLCGPLTLLGQDDQGQFVFRHPTHAFRATVQGRYWGITLDDEEFSIPCTQLHTPDGFQADLARVFGHQVLNSLQLVQDSVDAWMMKAESALPWRLYLTEEPHLDIRGMPLRNTLPEIFEDLLERCRNVVMPVRPLLRMLVEPDCRETITLDRPRFIPGSEPSSHHARMDLYARIHATGVQIGMPNLVKKIRTLPKPRV